MSKPGEYEPKSLRLQIRMALLVIMGTLFSHGTPTEVETEIKKKAGRGEKLKKFNAGAATFKIQLSQVRSEVLESIGVPVPEVSGRLTKVQITELKRRISLKGAQGKIKTELRELRKAA